MIRKSLNLLPPPFVLLALGLFTAGCAKATAAPEAPRRVRTVTVSPTEGNETLVQTGEVQARRETDLGFPVDGRLVRRLVDVGAFVEKGQLLATLDDVLVQNEVRATQADLTSATSALELAQSSQGRQQKLFEGRAASAQQLDEANANVKAASARKDVAAAAALNAKRKLVYSSLLAAESGVVTAVGANAGQVLAPGQMVVRVATRERDAVFSVAERVVASAPPDVKVTVRLVSNPAVTVVGSVREVAPTADPVTHTYRVRVALPDTAKELSFGASVTGSVEFPVGRYTTLPSTALTSDKAAPAVYVVDKSTSKLVARPIKVARFAQDRIFVASGLEVGERVVTAGVSKLRPEQLVAIDDTDGGAP